MIVLILLAFAGMLAGIFLLLGMTPFEFAEDLTKSFASREAPISKRIGQLNHPSWTITSFGNGWTPLSPVRTIRA